RARLQLSIEEQLGAKGADSLFALLRERAEQVGIFVILEGDLGSSHSQIPLELFRGLAIADDVAPLVPKA
ncbi:MAG: hypothetical protein AAGJ56_09955, partial [Myxococcota bacterium]